MCVVLATSYAQDIFIFSQQLLVKVEAAFGQRGVDKILNWQDLISKAQGQAELDKLKLVNDFFNQVPFISDQHHWQQEDYWATPIEFLATDGGDCEDFSLAKYFTLVQLGIEKSKLRLVYVKALALNQAHMVLTYTTEPGAIPLVLDNLKGAILSADHRPDLRPVYSFNGDGLWLAKLFGTGKRVQDASNYSLWREFETRLHEYHAD